MRKILRCTFAITFSILLSAVAGRMATASSSDAVDMVVVHVVGAPYERGARIDGNQPVHLKSGWSLTLAGSDGSFVTLTGPSDKAPAMVRKTGSGDPRIVEALGALLSSEQRSTAALGVIRSGSSVADAKLPDAWAVSVDQPGSRCIRRDMAVLWRDNNGRSANVTIKPFGGAREATVHWPAGQGMLAVSATSFRDGQRYVVDLDDHPVHITMHVMPADIKGAVRQAAWMASSGCRNQALAMLERVR